MTFFENKFEEYLDSHKKKSLHPSMKGVFSTIGEGKNIVLYGPPGIGKYTQALNFIEQYSPSNLKYERKMNITVKDKNYIYKISDIHFEIDMELLGCNARVLWNEIYSSIIDIIKSRPSHTGIILCKNFHKIHNELLDTFYSYMQMQEDDSIKLSYVLITEAYSFIPNNILKRCKYIPIKRPSVSNYKKCFNIAHVDISEVTNIKLLKCNITKPKYNTFIYNILDSIENYKDIDYLTLREQIYNLFIYQLDITNNIWMLFEHFSNKNLDVDKLDGFLQALVKFLKYYNNNYRPIYHLERLIYNLTSIINELS
jgi:hypothetical protein